jgi:hypothetical protein
MEIKNNNHNVLFTISVDTELADIHVADFARQCNKLINIYAKKNHDYGNSFEEGVIKLGDMYCISRLYDKVNRLIALHKTKSVVNESIEDTYTDLANYAIMYLCYYANTFHPVKKQKDNE